MEPVFTTEAIIALLTLTSLEIVLGIDNIIFLTILVDRLPQEQRQRARTLGLGLAMISRIGLLLSLTWIMRLTDPLFTVLGEKFSGRDLILLCGGLFLIAKSTHEIHQAMDLSESMKTNDTRQTKPPSKNIFIFILIQIAVIDIVFSLDSVITAVGMVDKVWVMISAIVLSVMVMLVAAKPVGEFVSQHPTLKVLALSFLILIGVSLVGESLDFQIPKGYIYFAMSFSFMVEMLNTRLRKLK